MSDFPIPRPYGIWSSPIHADSLLGGARLNDVAFDGATGQLLWSESSEGKGGLFAVPRDGSAPRDLTPRLNVRGRLGYGGGEFTVHDGVLYFAADEGRLYRQPLDVNEAQPITPAFGAAAAPKVHPTGRFVAYVHSVDDVDRIALVDAEGRGWPHILMEGADFYAHPAWHPDGELFAWISWNFPDMPWDRATLHVAHFEPNAPGGPRLVDVRTVAGGPRINDKGAAQTRPVGDDSTGLQDDGISAMQPAFSPDGRLLTYISDDDGFWHLYAYDLVNERRVQITEGPYEHGMPVWVQGQRHYAFAPDGRSLFFIRNDRGWHSLWQCTLYDEQGELRPRTMKLSGDFGEYAVLSQIAVATAPTAEASNGSAVRVGSALSDAGAAPTASASEQKRLRLAFVGEGPETPPRIVKVELPASEKPPATAHTDGSGEGPAASTQPSSGDGSDLADGSLTDGPFPRITVVRRSRAEGFPPGLLSVPKTISWTAPDGTEVHGLYYAPTNPRFVGRGGLPPAVVSVHSGPTRQSVPEFNGKAQFFTSRGYAYVEPNYRGSTGYGRAYRNKLRGQWGVVDVEDAIGAARWLVQNDRVDGDRLVIMGSSSGGFTALKALVDTPGFFKAAINMYGVVDLFGLAMDTHKFERHYTDGLVGPLPEAAPLYRKRSPLFYADKIQDPVAVFQGDADPVVPKSQSDAIVAALRRNGVPCEYFVFEGEGHGWRRAETVRAVYDAIEKFLHRFVLFS